MVHKTRNPKRETQILCKKVYTIIEHNSKHIKCVLCNNKTHKTQYVNRKICFITKSNEILDFYEHSLHTPSKSAFTQQRYKFQPEGWGFLFRSFTDKCRTLSDTLYCGYRILACDGSDVNIAREPSDERTFIHEGEKGYNAIHINALYDIMGKTYCDFLVQGKKKLHERAALNTMIDRYNDPAPAILLADRGYEGYNTYYLPFTLYFCESYLSTL